MVIDTFFDLQRFANDNLKKGDDGFYWEGGASFSGTNSRADDSLVGTAEDYARLEDTTVVGALSTAGTANSIYLNGKESGAYSFNVEGSSWEIGLDDSRDVVHVGANGLDSIVSGEVALTVAGGRRNTFTETINGTPVYIQSDSGTAATVTADGSAVNYEFAGAGNDTVGVSTNVTAVFQAANGVELKPQADASVDGVKNVTAANATVTSDGSANVNIAVKDAVTVGNAAWAFTNNARDAATVTANASDGITKVDGYTTSATLTAKSLDSVEVNGTDWYEIDGKFTNITFDKDGDAKVNNTGTVTVSGGALAGVTFATVTSAGVVANNATIEANASLVTAVLGEAEEGVAEIAVSDSMLAATVSGDDAFFVTVNDGATDEKTYAIGTTADDATFYASKTAALMSAKANEAYTIEGGTGALTFADSIAAHDSAQVSVNGAAVTITNNGAADNYVIGTEKGNAGIAGVMLLKANDAINVSGDDDGYTALFSAEDTSGVLTFTANGKTVSVNAADVGTVTVNGATLHGVVLDVDANDAVLVQGINDSAIVTVGGGNATYYFNSKKDANRVIVDQNTNVTIDSGIVKYDVAQDGVVDYRRTTTQPAVTADNSKWAEIATIGSADDSVNTHKSEAFNTFYDLDSNSSVLSFESDNDTAPSEAEGGVIEISGETALGSASHVSLKVSEGGGSVPLNIQQNENDSVVEVNIDLTGSDNPSTVAIGTIAQTDSLGNPIYVTASHEVSLSNASGGYAYIGEGATGQNKIFGGTGADMLRHDGAYQATLLGGDGNDTIRGGENDVVSGGNGADYFYDTAAYALDYNPSEDIIIATRVKDFGDITSGKVHGAGNQIAFGDGDKKLLTLSNYDPNEAIHVKVALMDNDGNILPDTKNIVLANANGTVTVDSSAATNGAIIFANATERSPEGVHTVIGTAGNDSIYIGSNDFADGAGGNDRIFIDNDATNVRVSLGAGTGLDTISGWNYGFELGSSVVETGGTQVRARVYEDMLHISLQGAATETDALLFANSTQYGSDLELHGQYNVLVGDKKYTAIRNNGDSDRGEDSTSKGYAEVTNDGDVADYYVAERNGIVRFTNGVTQSFVGDDAIVLGSEKFWAIRELTIANNGKASVFGSATRETVTVGGDATVGANKHVSLGAENDVIISTGDDSVSAGNKFYFGAGDGRDTIQNFSHYLGVDLDPDKQMVDTLVLESYTGLKVAKAEGRGDRIEIGTTETDRVIIYEEDGVSLDKIYNIQVGDLDAKLTKIGSSEGGNNFAYEKKVEYYVGASGDAHDTLTIGIGIENADVRLDGFGDTFYRGIDVVDASAEEYTNISIGGSADNNTITAGGVGTTNFLWGGAGDNSLIGGDGVDYFLYYFGSDNYVQGGTGNAFNKGNNDTIEGYNCDQDFIFLNDVTIDQIDQEAMGMLNNNGITTENVTVKFKNGGSLTVNVTDQERVAFYMKDASSASGYSVYSAERSDGAWHSAQVQV